jgi:hypothetical protein
MADQTRAGAAYSALIVEQLTEERDRKKVLEAKGSAILTTSASLTTLLFGLAALVTGVKGYNLPATAQTALLWAFLAFAVAALLGLLATWPMKYREALPENLQKLTEANFWNGPADVGDRRAAELRVRVIARARDRNRRKAILVVVGMFFEFVAALILSYAIFRVFNP